MPKISVIGLGRSISGLLKYLEKLAGELSLSIQLLDVDLSVLNNWERIYPQFVCKRIDNLEKDALKSVLGDSYIVVSILPAALHI